MAFYLCMLGEEYSFPTGGWEHTVRQMLEGETGHARASLYPAESAMRRDATERPDQNARSVG